MKRSLKCIIFYSICFLLTESTHFAQSASDTTQINTHLIKLTKTAEYRHFMNVNQLNETASYIFSEFSKHSDSVDYQLFNVNKNEYKNVICSFGTDHTQRVIIGAHYDVCGNQEGADDNASGVAGLLELARLLKNSKLPFRLDLVAYSLEEPPFFRTKSMGSYVHAQYLKNNQIPVIGMISVEMIGYFSEQKNSQDYPISLMKLKYGSRGNFITLVRKSSHGSFVKQFCKAYKKTKQITTKKFTAPQSLTGIDFSDHLNYWNFGFDALMITDTSFYRNKNYHQESDTMETLNIPMMAKVINGIYLTLISM